MLIERDKAQLLVIDMQERLVPAMHEGEQVVDRTALLMQVARRLGLPYLYLGYWIEGSRKMSYKTRYQPQEQLGPNGWVRVPAPVGR